MVVAQLHFVRMRVETGSAITDATARQAVMARIDDVRADVAAAERALAQLPRPDLDLAARHLAHIQFLLSQSWRRQLAGIAADASLVGAIVHAANFDTEQLRNQLAAGIRATAPELVRRSGESFGLTCAACAADAVTCTVTRGADGEAQQVMVSSVSPVTVFRSLAGTRMQDLLALLEAGDGEAVVHHLVEAHASGCDAHCPACDRVYCRTHAAIEAQWSGSWHEATFATCPLGHQRTID
jgi:hypothetical protein